MRHYNIDKNGAKKATLSQLVKWIIVNEIFLTKNDSDYSPEASFVETTNEVLYRELNKREKRYTKTS